MNQQGPVRPSKMQKTYRVDQKKGNLNKNGHNSSEIRLDLLHLKRGVTNFKFIFLSHFYTNFERFGAYLAAFLLNFLRHTNFFPFWWISEELWPFLFRSPFFWSTLYVFCILLGLTGPCWFILGLNEPYFLSYLALFRPYLALFGPYWTLLGLFGPY